MTQNKYNQAIKKLYEIWYLKPPEEQISKYLKLMHESLVEEWGFSCKKEILAMMVNDTNTIRLYKTRIKQLLYWEET
jgi:hypothetical protein